MKKNRRVFIAIAFLVVAIVISIAVQLMRNKIRFELQSSQINQAVNNETETIHHEIVLSFSSVEILAYFFQKNSAITRKEFQNYTAPIYMYNHSIKAISWVPKIKNKDRTGFETEIRNEKLISNFTITELKNDKLNIANERPLYFAVKYIEPFNENINALGYDIYSNDIRKIAITNAIQTQKLAITSKIKLVQDSLGFGFLVLIPAIRQSVSSQQHDSIENIIGLISAVFNVNQLMGNAFKNSNSNVSQLIIYDITDKKKDEIYNNVGQIGRNNTVQKKTLNIAGRVWELNFVIDNKLYHIDNKYSYSLIGISTSLCIFILILLPLIKTKKSRILAKRLSLEQSVRKKTEQTLSEREAYNRILFTQATIGLTLNSMDGKFVDVNPAYAAIIGRTIYETLNLTYWEITPEKYIQEENKHLDNLLKLGSYGPYEKEYIHKDGFLVPVRQRGKLIELSGVKYMLLSIENITESKQMEIALKESESRLKMTLEVTQTGIWDWNLKDDIWYASPLYYTILGYEPVDGNSDRSVWIERIHPDHIEHVKEKIREVIEGNASEYQYEALVKHADGTFRWQSVLGFAVERDENGKATRMLGTRVDITERKLIEEALIKLNHELEQRVSDRTAQLEAANKELEAFSYSVSHDLRAPLRHISGYIDLIKRRFPDSLPEKGQQFLNNISESAIEMGALIDDLLLFSRTSRQELKYNNTNMNALVDESIKAIEHDNANQKIDWMIKPLPNVWADSNLLKLVWINLLSNAAKFTRKKENALIEIECSGSENEYIFSVRDNGAGFDMQYASKLFGVFQRLHSSADYEGTGIGLANVQRIITRHGGRVWAEAEVDKGATFYFSLPKNKNQL